MLLFSRVSVLKDMLINQDTAFTSGLMQDLCHLLQICHLRTWVYHPQTGGLVECFNQMLKRILHLVVDMEGHNWDLLLPYILFRNLRDTPSVHGIYALRAPVWKAAVGSPKHSKRGMGGAALAAPRWSLWPRCKNTSSMCGRSSRSICVLPKKNSGACTTGPCSPMSSGPEIEYSCWYWTQHISFWPIGRGPTPWRNKWAQ